MTTRTQATPTRSWPDDALLLVAHGAVRFADAGRLLHAHAAVLRAQGRFAEVAVGLLNGRPAAVEALAGLAPNMVHVVPFFMEQGWFVREAIPRALGDGQGHALRYHQPVGLHPGMADLAAARVRHACGTDAARIAVLLVGHGSARAPGRPMALHRHVAALSAAGHFSQVRAAFLAEPPMVVDALRDWRGLPVAVVGWFAGEGGHVREDLPALLAAEQAARSDAGASLLDLGVISDDRGMPCIMLDQVAGGIPSPAAAGEGLG
ncbi:MAG TPA: CbiX/SirB N-terminal domain-containing protein [Acetobacteraceae bacterium]|nr:CbiX/SirB N-terminal domain-containing protein [Acetobacteraceae bacterium]